MYCHANRSSAACVLRCLVLAQHIDVHAGVALSPRLLLVLEVDDLKKLATIALVSDVNNHLRSISLFHLTLPADQRPHHPLNA